MASRSVSDPDIAAQAVLRPGRSSDVDALLDLARRGGSGLTNLPPDREALLAKLVASENALVDEEVRERGAATLLIVESGGEVVGTSCVFVRVGAEWPFYSYRLTRQASRSLAIGKLRAQVLLNLVNDFDGEAEVGGLFIDPRHRGGAFGTLAARGRYLFIAAHREWFAKRVIAELRGWQNGEGQSPMWEAVGRHFYDMDFHDADRTGALSGNQFIADLGPRYPLYVALLPPDAQEAIGRPHDDGRPAYDMLMQEGFASGDYVDIFDGGPTVVADIDAVRTVREARVTTMTGTISAPGKALVSTGRAADFRVSRGHVGDDGQVDAALAKALRLKRGDTMLVVQS